MLETLKSPIGTKIGENPTAESISRKDVWTAWLGGLIDGEGCICAIPWKQTNPAYRFKRSLRVSVTIHNTHPLIIKRATEVLLDLGVKFCLTVSGKKGCKQGASVVIVGNGRVTKLLTLVLPYLTAKRRRAELVLDLLAYRESLAIAGRQSKGRFGDLRLWEDPKILSIVEEIKKETHDYPSVLNFSRKPNEPFGESSTTTRLPQALAA